MSTKRRMQGILFHAPDVHDEEILEFVKVFTGDKLYFPEQIFQALPFNPRDTKPNPRKKAITEFAVRTAYLGFLTDPRTDLQHEKIGTLALEIPFHLTKDLKFFLETRSDQKPIFLSALTASSPSALSETLKRIDPVFKAHHTNADVCVMNSDFVVVLVKDENGAVGMYPLTHTVEFMMNTRAFDSKKT